MATSVLPALVNKGLEIKANTIATKLLQKNGIITEVHCFDKDKNKTVIYQGKTVILAAGTLASAHLLLASGLEKLNPGGKTIGRYLTRHCNAIAFGFFPKKPNPKNEFHKQIGIHDFYFGHPSIQTPRGKLGSMQQLQTPPVGLVHSMVPKPFGKLLGLGVPHLTGLLVMAEDQPKVENHVAVDFKKLDKFGWPQLLVTHNYTERDYAAREALLRKAGEILKKAGALFCYMHKIKTFSHAVGTVRMGHNPETSALDAFCQFRGVENLYVVDGSFMPTSGGLNPSLTIAANALRVGDYLVI
jgi:choline dehydrogenase-like flavoprotein